MGWRVYYPDDGETIDDARKLSPPPWKRFYDEQSVAEFACEYDYRERDGWERGMENRFAIVVVSEDGEETMFQAWNEVSVDHKAELDEAPR